MAIKVGHSTLHRMVARVALPRPIAQKAAEGMSVDGGKVCLRTPKGGQWRDYKLLSLHGIACEAFFQDPESIKAWYDTQPKAMMLTYLGDGHDGVWNVINDLTQSVLIQRQVRDRYHLIENLYKVGGSLKRLEMVKNYLWQGWVEQANAVFDELNNPQARNFQAYLQKQRHRIPCYRQYQQWGIPIGSGDVESRIKQVGARVKLPGARWLPQNVPRILHLRCAYLNRDDCLSISTHS